MADFLTHLFLPLTAAYVLRRELFPAHRYLALGGFGLLSDFDKFLGMPGLLHSLVTLIPIVVLVFVIEFYWWDRFTYASMIAGLILSHPILDFIDGGPVPLLFPIYTTGIGLEYPVRTVFGEGLLGVTFHGPLVTLRTTAPRPGFNTYGFIDGAGVASLLVFVIIYLWADPAPSPDTT